MVFVRKYAAVFITVAICYYNSLSGTFVFDDSEAIVKNKDVYPQSPISNIFKNDFWGTDISLNRSHKSYRPITVLTYRLNVLVSNGTLNPFHFHLVNYVLYIVLCLLVMFTFEQLIPKQSNEDHKTHPAFSGGALFAVHPVHVESVAALVGRADLLSAILFFLIVLMYRSEKVKRSTVLMCALVASVFVAVLCKETAITVVVFCILDDFYQCVNNNTWRNKWFIMRNVFLIFSGLLILLLRLWIMNFEGPIFTKSDNPAAFSNSLLTKVLSYNYIYLMNCLLLVWPQWLCFDWSMGCIPLIETLCDKRAIFVILFWILIILTLLKLLKDLKASKKLDPRFLALALVIVPFLPAMNLFFTVGFVIAERTLLIPSAGYSLLVAIGLKKLKTRFKKHQNLLQLIFCGHCMMLALHTTIRNVDWLEEYTLFTSALQVCPNNAKVHYNVGKVSADLNRKHVAINEYYTALKLNPEYEQAMNNLANLLREENLLDEAEHLLRKAVQVRPNFAAAWMNLGIVLSSLGQLEEAEESYLKAIFYRSRYPDCYYNLGNLYLDQKRHEEALIAWENAVKQRSSHTAAWSNILVLLDTMERYNKAVEIGMKALLHNPMSPVLHFTMGNVLGKVRQFATAEKHFLEAIRLNSTNPLYYSNLGVLYHRWGKPEKAREEYLKALKLDPNMNTTKVNLKKLSNSMNM